LTTFKPNENFKWTGATTKRHPPGSEQEEFLPADKGDGGQRGRNAKRLGREDGGKIRPIDHDQGDDRKKKYRVI